MDYRAFSHGQIHSKIWLCENLEPYIPQNSRILILGSWYNLLGCMMLTRKPRSYTAITGVDRDQSAIDVANKICEPWMIAPTPYIQNVCADANIYDFNGYNVIINCSCEHIESEQWFNNITSGSLVCLQSSDVSAENKDWDILNPNPLLENFLTKFPLKNYFFKNEMIFNYQNFSFKRFMVIGIK